MNYRERRKHVVIHEPVQLYTGLCNILGVHDTYIHGTIVNTEWIFMYVQKRTERTITHHDRVAREEAVMTRHEHNISVERMAIVV